MFTLLKNGHLFAPDDMGIRNILICGDKIIQIKEKITLAGVEGIEIIDCQDCIVCPGIIDQHVHIIGGGGEKGPVSRIPEIMFSEITKAGITTIVGVLGFDSITRGICDLLAKARGLEAEGITTYIYTGSYGYPTATVTGQVSLDLVLLDKVLGAGEIALADYRSYHLSLQELRKLAAEVNTGGLLGGKAGVLHLHIGDGKEGLETLFRLINESDFPIDMFVPTHINRNPRVFQQGIDLLQIGGNIDLTAGEKVGYSIADSVEILLQKDVNLEKVTISSDGNGSCANGAKVNSIGQLWKDLKECILNRQLDFTTIMKMVTANPAKVLKLYPQKGCLRPGADADVLILKAQDLSIFRLLAKGEIVVKDDKAIKIGKFEEQCRI